jgi:hypothetical protein
MERVRFQGTFLPKLFHKEAGRSMMLRSMGPAWVRLQTLASSHHKALQLLSFTFADTCFRNDGVTGSSPVSGTIVFSTA